MQSPLIRLYIAASVDGFIATPDGGVGWLDPFQSDDLGYGQFLAEIGTVVMGRKTYDQLLGFGGGWPYQGKRTVVLTTRPLEPVAPDIEAWSGAIDGLVAGLGQGEGDVWLVGGAKAARPFFDGGFVDRIELSVIPVLLGEGIPLFERSSHAQSLRLRETKTFPNGIAQLIYDKG